MPLPDSPVASPSPDHPVPAPDLGGDQTRDEKRSSEPSLETVPFGRYELVRHLATGGMAEIHLARVRGIEGFEKLVVIKRIVPDLASNPEFVQMFLDEARIAATLEHPNIVHVYDLGKVDDRYFFSMEFLHGADVRSIIKRARATGKAVPLEHALNIIIGVCAGLHYAHERVAPDGRPLNIVHRDISPQNVFVTFDGVVKVVDFGIAKAANRVNETMAGSVKGKAPYMSPEQCRSLALDRRSDVFSAAIMLYELTTGDYLFRGESEFDIMRSIVDTDAPPPSTRRSGYPKALEAIVLKGLCRRVEARFQTAQEMELALEEFARERKLNVSPVALARYMEELFAWQIEAWREARKQGKSLARHIAELAPIGDPEMISASHRRAREGGPLATFTGEPGEPPPPATPLVGDPPAGVALRADGLRGWLGQHPLVSVVTGAVLAGALTAASVTIVRSHRGAHDAAQRKAPVEEAVPTKADNVIPPVPAAPALARRALPASPTEASPSAGPASVPVVATQLVAVPPSVARATPKPPPPATHRVRTHGHGAHTAKGSPFDTPFPR